MAFFAEAGLTAKISPSITSTRPSATMKSAIRRQPPKRRGMNRGAPLPLLMEHDLYPKTGTHPRSGSRTCFSGSCSSGSVTLFLVVFTRLAAGVGKIAEEIRVGPEHHAGIAVLEPLLIGLHRAIERKEVRVLAEGLGEDPIALRLAL